MISNYNILIFKIIFLYNIFQINAEIICIKFDLDNKIYNELTSQFNNLVKNINNGKKYYGGDFTYYIDSNAIYFDDKDDKLTVDLYFVDMYKYMYNGKEFTEQFLGKNYVIDKKYYKEITVKELTTAELKCDENILKNNYIYYIPQKIIQEIKNLKKKPIYRLLKNMYIEYLNKLQKEILRINEDENLPLKIAYENGDIYINCIPENFENLKLENQESVYTLKFKEKNDIFSKIPNDYIDIEEYENIINNFKYEYGNYKRLNKEEIKNIFLKSLKNNNNEILKNISTKASERHMDVYIMNNEKKFVRVKNDELLPYQTLYIDVFQIFIKEETYKNIENFKKDMKNILKELNSNKEENIEKLYEISKKTIKSLKEHNIKTYADKGSQLGISNTLEKSYSNIQGTGIYETIIRKIFLKIIEIKLKAHVEQSIKKLENIINYNKTVTEEFDKKQTLSDIELKSIRSTIKTHIKKIYEEILKKIGEDKNLFNNTAIPQYYDFFAPPYFLSYVEKSNYEESKNFKQCIDSFWKNIYEKIDEYEKGSKVYLRIIFDDSNSITLNEDIKYYLNRLSEYISNGKNYKYIGFKIENILNGYRYFKKYHNYTFVYLDENNNLLDENFIIPVTKKNYTVKFQIRNLETAGKVKKNIINTNNTNIKKNNNINHKTENITEKDNLSQLNKTSKINNIDIKKNNSINNKTENITEKNKTSQLNNTSKINNLNIKKNNSINHKKENITEINKTSQLNKTSKIIDKSKITNTTTYMNKTIDKSKIPNFKNNNIDYINGSNNGSSNGSSNKCCSCNSCKKT